MINRVSKLLGIKLHSVKEIHTKYFSFDDIQLLLKGDNHKKYILVLSNKGLKNNTNYILDGYANNYYYYLFNWPINHQKNIKTFTKKK